MHEDPIRNFLDFLVPPVHPRMRSESSNDGTEQAMALSGFEREMYYADSWRELRGFIEEIYRRMDDRSADSDSGEYNLFLLDHLGKTMVLGLRRDASGNALHIVQQEVAQVSRSKHLVEMQFTFDRVFGESNGRRRSDTREAI